MSQLVNAIVSLTLPGTILKRAVVPSLIDLNILIRHEAILTLITMVQQLQKYLSVGKIIYTEDTDFCAFQNYLLESAVKVHIYCFNAYIRFMYITLHTYIFKHNNENCWSCRMYPV